MQAMRLGLPQRKKQKRFLKSSLQAIKPRKPLPLLHRKNLRTAVQTATADSIPEWLRGRWLLPLKNGALPKAVSPAIPTS